MGGGLIRFLFRRLRRLRQAGIWCDKWLARKWNLGLGIGNSAGQQALRLALRLLLTPNCPRPSGGSSQVTEPVPVWERGGNSRFTD